MPWSLSSFPRLPFAIPFIFFSLALSIASIVLFSLDISWQTTETDRFPSYFIVVHHICMLLIFVRGARSGQLLRSQNKRASKFYVRVLWIPLVFSLFRIEGVAAMFVQKRGPQHPHLVRIIIAEAVLAGVEALVLMLLIFTAKYQDSGMIALHISDAEAGPPPAPRRPPWPVRAFGSKFSFDRSIPFSPWMIALSLLFTLPVLVLSFVNGGTVSFGLNPAISSLFLVFCVFLVLAYTDITRYGSGTAEPYLYRHSSQTLHFIRHGLRPTFLIITTFSSMLFFTGGTISWYHWFHYCQNRYSGLYGCYLKAPSSSAVFFEAFFAYAACAVTLLGMIVPLTIDLQVSFVIQANDRVPQEDIEADDDVSVHIGATSTIAPSITSTTPTSIVLTPPSRLPISLSLIILSIVISIAGFFIGIANFDLKRGDGFSAIVSFSFLFLHHLLLLSIFAFIRDFDPTNYVPTLHAHTACRIYVWILIFPMFLLLNGAASCAEDVFSHDNMKYGVSEGVVDSLGAVVLFMMIVTAKYVPYPTR